MGKQNDARGVWERGLEVGREGKGDLWLYKEIGMLLQTTGGMAGSQLTEVRR